MTNLESNFAIKWEIYFYSIIKWILLTIAEAKRGHVQYILTIFKKICISLTILESLPRLVLGILHGWVEFMVINEDKWTENGQWVKSHRVTKQGTSSV